MDSYNVEEILLETIKKDYVFLKELVEMAKETAEECREEWEENQENKDDISNPDLNWEYFLDAERILAKKIRRFVINHALNSLSPHIRPSTNMYAIFFCQEFFLSILERLDFKNVAEEILDIYKKDKSAKTPVYLKPEIV